MIKIICDRCGREIEQNWLRAPATLLSKRYPDYELNVQESPTESGRKVHLCEHCKNELKKFLRGEAVQGEGYSRKVVI